MVSTSGSLSAVVTTNVSVDSSAGKEPLRPQALQLLRLVQGCLCNLGSNHDAKLHSPGAHDDCAFISTLDLLWIKQGSLTKIEHRAQLAVSLTHEQHRCIGNPCSARVGSMLPLLLRGKSPCFAASAGNALPGQADGRC